jgi:hypothetical protein
MQIGTAVIVLALLAAPPATDFTGKWRIDKTRSDDVQARIEEVAGPGQVKSGGATGLTILPEGNTRSEVERVELREWMLGVAKNLDVLEVEQSPSEIKLYEGEGLRTFYFGREHVRQDSRGRKLKCQIRWQGPQLVLEESGDKHQMKLTEVLTLVPSTSQLIHVVRFENDLLAKPLEVRLVYARAN